MKTTFLLISAPFAASIPLFRYINDNFKCTNPGLMKSIDFSLLSGRWFQTHATWGTDYFGCLWTEYGNFDSDKFDLGVYWT